MKRIPALLLALVLAGCSTASPAPTTPPPTITLAGELTPYLLPPPSATPSPPPASTPTPLPTATPTPRTHIIKDGQDMFGLSLFYGISLDQLMTANPSVNPNAMSVGGELKIPPPNLTPTPDPLHPPLPAPLPLTLSQPACYPEATGGLWCFAEAQNDLTQPVEAVSAQFRVLDTASGTIVTQDAYAPLQVAGLGMKVPLAAFFPASMPAAGAFAAEVNLLTALPLAESQVRVVPSKLTDVQTVLSTDGSSAQVSGSIQPLTTSPAPTMLVVALTGYDSAGRVSGMRVSQISPLDAGAGTYAFELQVYAIGAPLTSVTVQAELLP